MVVRFDNKAIKQAIERKVDPIGVEGDPTSKKGGISETDAIIKEARKSLSIPDGVDVDEEIARISQEIIREEEAKESGPELKLDGSAAEAAKKTKGDNVIAGGP